MTAAVLSICVAVAVIVLVGGGVFWLCWVLNDSGRTLNLVRRLHGTRLSPEEEQSLIRARDEELRQEDEVWRARAAQRESGRRRSTESRWRGRSVKLLCLLADIRREQKG